MHPTIIGLRDQKLGLQNVTQQAPYIAQRMEGLGVIKTSPIVNSMHNLENSGKVKLNKENDILAKLQQKYGLNSPKEFIPGLISYRHNPEFLVDIAPPQIPSTNNLLE